MIKKVMIKGAKLMKKSKAAVSGLFCIHLSTLASIVYQKGREREDNISAAYQRGEDLQEKKKQQIV